MHRHVLDDRRVAQPGFRTSLVGDLKRQVEGGGACARDRDQGAQLVVVDFLPAEVLVVLDLPGGHLGRAELRGRRGSRHLDPRPVEVVPVRNLQVEPHAISAVGGGAKSKRLVGLQELVVAALRGVQHRVDAAGGRRRLGSRLRKGRGAAQPEQDNQRNMFNGEAHTVRVTL